MSAAVPLCSSSSPNSTMSAQSLNPSLFSSLPPSVQCLILSADAWLSSPLNTSHLRLCSFTSHDLHFHVPSFSASFSLSLATPHSLSVDSELLDDLESESFNFCFGGKERSVEELLTWVDQWLGKEGGDWVAKEERRRKVKKRNREDRTPEGDDDPKEEKHAAEDEGVSQSPAASDGWGGTEEEEEDGEDGWGEAVEYDLVTSSKEYESELTPDSIQLRKHQSYTIIQPVDLARLQSSMIKRVSSSLSITSSSACTLLRHCKWDEQETLRLFRLDSQKLATDAGVVTQLHTDINPPPDSSTIICCPICFDDVEGDKTFSMPCGHSFCVSCWKEYLRNQIEGGDSSGKNALVTRCPEGKCREVMGMEACEIILGEDESVLLSKYRQMLVRSFVDDSTSYAWCPKVGCERIVAGSLRKSTIECVCGHQFCFGCKQEAHAPAICQEALEWVAKDKGSENLDTKWILEQSKACPKCGTRTRKEGGCMHIVCTICSNPWCWQCGKSDHHVYECNRPPWGESKDGASDLNRYLWYYERYWNHTQSLKQSEQQLASTNVKMEQLVNEGVHFKSTEFLRQAVMLIIQCRRVLRWTYVHAFYIDEDKQRALFEYRQGELESMTEKLNKLTEEGVEQLQAKRGTVLNWTTALGSYLEGMENDQTALRITKEERKEGEGGGEKMKGKGKGSVKEKEEEEWKTDERGTIVRQKVKRKESAAGKGKGKRMQEKAVRGIGEPKEEENEMQGQEDEREEEELEDPELHMALVEDIKLQAAAGGRTVANSDTA